MDVVQDVGEIFFEEAKVCKCPPFEGILDGNVDCEMVPRRYLAGTDKPGYLSRRHRLPANW